MADSILKFFDMEPEKYESYCNKARETGKQYDFGHLTDELEEIFEEVRR